MRSPIAKSLLALAAAAAVFGTGYRLGDAAHRRATHRIDVTPDVLAGLRRDFQRRTGRLPNAADDAALVRRYLDQEVLYREALALGLDRGDVIVRRRLMQMMELRAEDTVASAPPSDAELAEELRTSPARYRHPARLAFSHVFLSRKDGVEAEAGKLLAALRHGADPAHAGEPFLRGRDLPLQGEAEVAAIFGAAFAASLASLPDADDGRWQGPVASSFGLHLVRIASRQPPRTPSLDEVRGDVARDVLEHRRAHARDQLVELLRSRYEVRLPRSAP